MQKLERGSPLANEFAKAVKDNSLREHEAKKVGAGAIAHIVKTRGGNKASFKEFLKEHNPATNQTER